MLFTLVSMSKLQNKKLILHRKNKTLTFAEQFFFFDKENKNMSELVITWIYLFVILKIFFGIEC